MMQWQDMSNLNSKYDDAWLSGLGAGVFDAGNVLTPSRGTRGLGALSFSQVQTLQDLLNVENAYRNRPPIQVTGTWNQETCLTVIYYAQLLQGGDQVDPFLFDMLYNNEQEIGAACTALSQGTVVQPSQPASPPPQPLPPPPQNDQPPVVAPPPPGPGTVSACTAAGCDCYVYEGDQGPHIQGLQQEINAALDAAGYQPITVTGVYDKATCGAIFELGGSFVPTYPANCTNPEGEWIVPLQCPDMVLPQKKAGSKKWGTVAIGGLIAAALLGGGYWVAQR